jgi:hypothetical protein
MLTFSNDRDILKHEAVLFSDLCFSWQILCEGTGGELDNTSFSVEGADFVSSNVSAGGVIYLRSGDGQIDGCYEIVSVDSATELTVSVLRANETEAATGPGSSTDVRYRVSTFAPQAYEAFFELTQHFGIKPGNPDSLYGVDDILDTSVLRQASVYAILAGIYATLGSKAGGDDNCWKKSLHYRRLFEKAREKCRLSIDIGGDGISERTSFGGSIRLVRD